MADEPMYEEWIASRREAEPSAELTDRVMDAIEQRDAPRRGFVRLADRMNESPLARLAACAAALLVGSLPFAFVVSVAQLPVF